MAGKPTYEELEQRVKDLEKALAGSELPGIEESLYQAEEMVKGILKIIPDTVSIKRVADDSYIEVNDFFSHLFGYSREEIIGKTPLELNIYINPSDRTFILSLIKEKGFVNGLEVNYRKKDGTPITTLLSAQTIRYNNEDCLVAVTRDISKLRETEQALRKSEEEYRLLIENANEGIIVIQGGQIVFINPQAMNLSGFSPDEIHQIQIGEFIHPEDREEAIGRYLRILQGENNPGDFEYRAIDGRGNLRWLRSRSVLIEWKKAPAVLTFASELTEWKKTEAEKKRLEALLRQSQKMEAIGTLAGGIAHDFNNILTAIMGYAELSLFDLPKRNPSRDHIIQVLKATGRAKDLVQQILTFSRQSEQEDRPILISQVAKEVLKLLRASLPSTIEIRTKIQKEAGAVLADPTQIQQVIMNLCTNAAYAMREKGGVLDVRVEDIEMGAEQSKTITDRKPGLYIKITIKDTGEGMTPETMEHIFEPYFTTKEKETGTGLGLAVVHGIIKRLNGYIQVESRPETGTTFTIFFPKIGVSVTEKIEPLALPPMGHERILIVDDEEIIITLEKEMLQRLGYTVVSRTSPLEALEVFRAKSGEFDLVITDQTMPHMTGEHLAQKLIEIKPDIPIVLCTGYSAQIDENSAKALGIREFIMKPIVLLDLARIIRKVLDQSP